MESKWKILEKNFAFFVKKQSFKSFKNENKINMSGKKLEHSCGQIAVRVGK